MKSASRGEFAERSEAAGLASQFHSVDAPVEVRRRRVLTRNVDRGETGSLEVTPGRFDVMESQFERPLDAALEGVAVVNTHEAADQEPRESLSVRGADAGV